MTRNLKPLTPNPKPYTTSPTRRELRRGRLGTHVGRCGHLFQSLPTPRYHPGRPVTYRHRKVVHRIGSARGVRGGLHIGKGIGDHRC